MRYLPNVLAVLFHKKNVFMKLKLIKLSCFLGKEASCQNRPEVIKFFHVNSAGHEIFPAHKC